MSTVLLVITLVSSVVAIVFSALTIVNVRAGAYYRRLVQLMRREAWDTYDHEKAHPPVSVRVFEATERWEARLARVARR